MPTLCPNFYLLFLKKLQNQNLDNHFLNDLDLNCNSDKESIREDKKSALETYQTLMKGNYSISSE